jgi:hypothetical protein
MRRSLLGLSLLTFLSFAPATLLAAPTKAKIIRVSDGNPTQLKLALGAKKGAAVGLAGYLVDKDGNKIKGSEFKVTEVSDTNCTVEVKMDSTKIDGDFAAVLELP